jgi:cell division septal protein FtsQ
MGARPLSSRLPRLRSVRMPDWHILRRRLLAAALVLAVLAAVYMLWFRDSSFVRIENVEVVGADGDASVAAALEAAAQEQTTLHLDTAALREAVADNPAVAGLSAETDFPNGVTIAVDLRQPAGYLDADGGTIVAGDGTVLRTGVERPEGLPAIDADASTSGPRVDGDALAAAQVLGGVPPVLAPQVDGIAIDPKLGPVATLNGGVEIRFGDATRADMKWRAVAAVLANPDVTTLNYLDVSVPSRPVSG